MTKPLRLDGFRLLPKGMRKCCKCHEIKAKKYFYKDSRRASGVQPKCKECTNKDNKTKRQSSSRRDLVVRRKWAEENREKLREQDRQYRENNRDKRNASEGRRRARKLSLPNTLTSDEYSEIKEYFSNLCAICERVFEHMDHFIPLSSGHGGTTFENMVPMCSRCNLSKKDRNPFEWSITLDKKERENFDSLVCYLASINGITSVTEYEAHVNKCFK